MSDPTHSIQYGNTSIAYRVLRRKGRKTLEINVDRTGRVGVTAPFGITHDRIESTVRSKAPWIMAQWRRQARLMPQPPRRQFVSGEAVPYLGRTYQIRVVRVEAQHASMTVQAGTIAFRVPKYLSASGRRAACQRLLVQWLRDKAEHHGTRVCGKVCNRLGLDPAEVVVRELGRRWGSCTPTGRVLLNWKSVLAPMRLFEYICAHEVCHLVHPDHSAAFRRTLDRVVPRWRELASQLESRGYRYEI
jgi:predicted metal-dependent hydrolase